MPKLSTTAPRYSLRRTLVASILLVVFVGLSVIAATDSMGAFETMVFNLIYSMPENLRWFALLVTQFGSGWVVAGTVGLLFVIRKNPLLALIVFRNSVLTYVLVECMKFVVSRPRPMLLLSEVSSREVAVYGSGFPSGHTALATVLSLTVLPYLPKKLYWLPFVWIILVGWSRIYLGVHAPFDVIGGFVVGAIVALVADALPWPKR